MSGKSVDPSTKWSSIVISWVNLFETDTLSKISSLKNSNFFVETITTIFKLGGKEEVSFKSVDDLVVQFIKGYFPEIIKEKRFNIKNEDDVLVLVSLLMYTTCIKFKIEDFVVKTCSIKLDDNLQEAMKKFFELMLTIEDGSFTRRNIMDTVQQCFDPVAVSGARKSLSPSASRNCLRDILGSPLQQEKYKLMKKESDLRQFNVLLQEENSELTSEKESLAKKNHELELTNKTLQAHLNDKQQEIHSLKEELWQYENKGTKEDIHNHYKSLKEENDQLKRDLDGIRLENDLLLQENEKYLKQNRHLEVGLKESEDDIFEKIKIIDRLKEELGGFQEKNMTLENEIKELNQLIEQYQEERSSKDEFDLSAPRVEENLGQVFTDLELREKQETINRLQEKIKSMERLCEEKDGEIKQLEISRRDLENRLQLKCNEFEELTRVSLGWEQQVGDLASKNESLKEELSLGLAKIGELEMRLKEATHQLILENAAKDAEMQEAVKTLEREKKEIHAKFNDENGKVKQLKTNLKSIENKLKSKCSEFEDLKHFSTDLQLQVGDLTAKITTLQEELTQALTKTQELEKQLYESNQQMNNEIAERDSQLAQSQEIIHALETEKETLKAQIENQVGMIEQLEFDKKDLESKVLSLCSELDDLACSSSGLQRQIVDLSANNVSLKEELSLALARTEVLQNQLNESTHHLTCEIEEKDLQLKQLQELTQMLQIEKMKIEAQIEDQTNQIKQLEICKTDLEDQLKSKSSECDVMCRTSTDFEQQICDLSAKNVAMEEELSLAVSRIEELEKQLSESNHQVCEIAEKNSQLTELQQVIQTLEMEKKEIQAQIEDQLGDIKQLETSRTDLENKLFSKCCELEDLEQQVSVLSSNVETLEKELSLALAKGGELEKHLHESNDQLNCEIAQKQLELEEKVSQLAKKESELDEKDSQLSLKDLQLAQKESEFEEKNSLLAQKESLLEVKDTHLAQKDLQLEEKDIQIAEKDSQIAQKDSQLKEKDIQMTQLQTVINNLELKNKEIKDQENSVKAKIIDLETKIEAKEAECVVLNKELEHVNSVLLSLQTEYNLLDIKNKELTSQLSSVTAGAAHLENVIQEDNFKIDFQERTIKKLESASHEQDKIIKQLQDEILKLKKVIDEYGNLTREKETDVENLQVQLNIKSSEIDRLKEEVEKIVIEKEALNNVFSQVEVEKAANQKYIDALSNENSGLKNNLKERDEKITLLEQDLLHVKEQVAQLGTELDTQRNKLQQANETCDEISEENNSLKKQLENNDPQLKEAYDKLFDDYHRLNGEHDELKVQLENVRAKVRAEYDEILAKMKSHMKSTCTRALETKDEKHAKELKDLKEVVKANQDHISQLSTNLWDTSDKLLITKNENEELRRTVRDLKKMLSLHQSAPDGLQRTRSHDQLGLLNQNQMRMMEEETVTVSRRQSIRTVPSGMGKVFPSEDEAEEMFNNDCLADLKAGRCQVAAADPDRVSTLMYRNSLCPPHLKSSYPAETQFLPVDNLQEDDIKGSVLGDDTKLLPDKRRKDRSQTELRNVTTPRGALRELNDENRRPATPSRIFSNIFGARQRRNENLPATPDKRRLSIFKHFKKEPTD